MIKAIAKTPGEEGDLIILGITELNIKLLREGRPIKIRLSSMIPGNKDTIYIVYGKDESALLQELHPMISGDTEIH